MPPESPQLPPKPEVALALLQTAASIYVHLDPRGQDVFVPAWFKNQPQLVIQVGLNMAVPIPDLDVGQESMSCTLSFNRRPEFCRIPWTAIYGLVGEDGRGMIWPESIPPEVASTASASADKKPHLRVAEASAGRKTKERAKKTNSAEAEGGQTRSENTPPAQPKRRATKKKPPVAAVAHPVVEAQPSAPVHTAAPVQTAPTAPTGSNSSPRRELPPYLRVVK